MSVPALHAPARRARRGYGGAYGGTCTAPRTLVA